MKIKVNRFIWAVSVSLIFCIVSCTANLEMRKKQGKASRNLGETYMYQGNYTAALNELLKAQEFYAQDPYLQNDLGLTYMLKGKPDIAIDHFKKAIKIKPDYTPAKNNLGKAYLAKKDWDSAILCLKEITGDLLYATPHYPLSNLGWAYYNKKDYKAAEKYYLDALKISPDFAFALSGLGMTYLKMGNVAEAVAILEKGVKNAPNFALLYFDLARAYTFSGNYKKACNAYDRVIELAKDTPLAREAKKKLQTLRSEIRNQMSETP